MASLQERSGAYRVIFRFRGKQHFLAIGKVTKQEAEAKAAQVDYLLMRIKQGLIELPPGVDIAEFVKHDGKPPAAADGPVAKPVAKATLATLRDRFLSAHSGALEENTLYTSAIHFRHLATTLGEGFPLRELQQADLQRHVDRRVKSPVSPTTARKEITTLRAAWNWGRRAGLIASPYPNEGLIYPKTDAKPRFQTYEEINRQIARGGLTDAERSELWECLFLTAPEIADLLEVVRARAAYPWIHPMFAFAAHTGARRSEMLRAKVADVDFEGETVVIREKKREKGRRTTRQAPLSPALSAILKDWLAIHPGGQHLFCQPGEVKRSRTRGMAARARGGIPDEPGPLTRSEASDHFHRPLAGTKWEAMRGWHVLRHSFITCCVAAGVDQRLIDDWVGHTTEEMRQRYRHLVPSVQRLAIRSVFG